MPRHCRARRGARGASSGLRWEEEADTAIGKLKAQVVERGGLIGIRSLFRCLENMDDSGDGELDRHELRSGLHDFGVVLTTHEIHALMKLFDRDGGGTLTLDELRDGVRGQMSSARLTLINNVCVG